MWRPVELGDRLAERGRDDLTARASLLGAPAEDVDDLRRAADPALSGKGRVACHGSPTRGPPLHR